MVPTLEDQLSLGRQAGALQELMNLPTTDAIGVACSFLLHCAHNHPDMASRVLREKVIKEGFTGVSLIETLNRVVR